MKLRYKSFLEQISTKPNPDSIKWAGKQFSLLSAILLWAMWLCRVLSALQIIKFLFRKIVGWLKSGTVDNGSGRVNVPPIICEIYYIIWTVFFIFVHHGMVSLNSTLLLVLAYYYLFESIVWVLYYTIFRRFFEAGYSIYHELEYLTVLLLVIPTQALSFAHIYGMSFREMLAGLLGSGSENSPFPVMILGALFAAIVISMIISAFPTEAVKKHAKSPKMFVIGNGDVVKNRLVPALLNSGSDSDHIFNDFDITNADKNVKGFDQTKPIPRICKLINDNTDRDSIVWIETPTYTHAGYLKAMLDTPTPLIVMEKPIAASEKDLCDIENIIADPSKRKKIFFLSYYLLEKALPLYYISDNNTAYEEYLDIDDRLSLNDWRVRLGALHSLDICIYEGEDRREWVYDKENGGQWLETFLHNILIASLFCGQPDTWQIDKLNIKDSDILLAATQGCAKISLSLKKNMPKENLRRFAKLDFANGTVYADFDAQRACVHFNDLDKDCHISVKDQYRGKYYVMVDLVKRVKDGQFSSEQTDGLFNQLHIIRWMLNQTTDSENKS